MMGGVKAHYEGIKAFSETDFTEDVKMIAVPTLVMHGDDDQVVPIADSAELTIKLLKQGTLAEPGVKAVPLSKEIRSGWALAGSRGRREHARSRQATSEPARPL